MKKSNDMQKNNNAFVQDVRNKPLAYIVQAVGLLVVLFNLWIASKLSPIVKDITVIQNEVQAIVERQDKVEINTETYVKDTASELKIIDSRLDKMHEDIIIIKNTLNYLKKWKRKEQ